MPLIKYALISISLNAYPVFEELFDVSDNAIFVMLLFHFNFDDCLHFFFLQNVDDLTDCTGHWNSSFQSKEGCSRSSVNERISCGIL